MNKHVDWLAVAIGNLGGIEPASKVLGHSTRTLITWLEEGLSGVSFENVAKLSEKGDVPLNYLARRLEPWKE